LRSNTFICAAEYLRRARIFSRTALVLTCGISAQRGETLRAKDQELVNRKIDSRPLYDIL
jgi:hypothetical protein